MEILTSNTSYVDDMLKSTSWFNRYLTVRRYVLHTYQIDECLDDTQWAIRQNVLRQANVQPHHIDKALNDEEVEVRHTAYHHHLTTEDQKIEYKLKYGDIR